MPVCLPRFSHVAAGVAALLMAVVTAVVTPVAGQVIRSGPPTCRGVALTFDMCPVRDGGGYDAELIRLLIERHIPATFFLSGRWMTKHDEQVRALRSVPYFELGTHGKNHSHLPLLDPEQQRVEIEAPAAMLKSRYGIGTDLFRPPYGEFDERTVSLTETLGLRFILWNVVSGDPDPSLSAEQILTSVLPQLRNGAVVVFHGNGKGKHTRMVVEQIDQRVFAKKALRPVTVSQLLDGCGDGVVHGRQ